MGGSIFSYNAPITSVTIPNSVIEIGKYAFSSCSSLSSIEIPGSVRKIGYAAFSYCSSLESVEICNGVKVVDDYAFSACGSLNSIKIPESVISMDNAFSMGTYDSIFLSFDLEEAKGVLNSYFGCPSLVSIDVNENNANYSSVDGVLFNKDKTTLIVYPAGKTDKSYSIPKGVTKIKNDAFIHRTTLTSVIIPDSVTEIGDRAFEGCSSLTSVDIPKNVTEIGMYAFYDCNSLESINIDKDNTNYSSAEGVLFDKGKTALIKYPAVKKDKTYSIPDSVMEITNGAFHNCADKAEVIIPEGVTSIGNGAFWNCTSLTAAAVPSTVTYIGWQAFQNCSSLTSINIPNGVTGIKMYTFSNCSSLTSVKIPDSVTEIRSSAFSGCTSLKSVNIPKNVTLLYNDPFANCTSLESFNVDKDNLNYSSENGVLFNKDKTELIKYPVGKTDIIYSIPSSVTSIDSYAFRDCTSLTVIEIPDSVTSIGYRTFYNCASLTIYGSEDSYAQAYAEENEIPFKIINKEALIDHENNVILENPNLEGMTLEVEETAVSDEEKMIFNITLKNEKGEEIQPEGEVTVKIPLPQGWDTEKATVSRREADGKLTDMKAVYENGYMVFVTDHFSEYILAIKPDVIIGDINADTNINAVDAKMILQYASGSRQLTPEQEAAADVNNDGNVNAVDAKWILQYASGSRDW